MILLFLIFENVCLKCFIKSIGKKYQQNSLQSSELVCQ